MDIPNTNRQIKYIAPSNHKAFIKQATQVLIFNSARFWDVLPFIVFFGLHPLINELQLKFRWKKWLAFALKAVWFDGAMYIAWRFAFDMTTVINLPHELVILLLVLVGTAFFYLYDYTTFKCRAQVNSLVNRLLRKK